MFSPEVFCLLCLGLFSVILVKNAAATTLYWKRLRQILGTIYMGISHEFSDVICVVINSFFFRKESRKKIKKKVGTSTSFNAFKITALCKNSDWHIFLNRQAVIFFSSKNSKCVITVIDLLYDGLKMDKNDTWGARAS